MIIERHTMTKKTEKKTAKKKNTSKIEVNKISSATKLQQIDSKLTPTKENLESQVEDLSAQVKILSKKSGKKALKLLKKLDENYHRKLANLQTEFEERLASLSKMKGKVLKSLPKVLSEKISSNESVSDKSAKPVNVIHKTPVLKPQPKAAIKTTSVASIKSIGPVMQKKLADKGISTLDDIANTPKNKIELLKQFAKERGFSTWKEQAKSLLADNEMKDS
jgi:predicted flap endonuclease-1-like 5' DNA nuclease